MKALFIALALLVCAQAQATTKEELKAARAALKQECLQDAACAASMEAKAEARRAKALQKIEDQRAALRK